MSDGMAVNSLEEGGAGEGGGLGSPAFQLALFREIFLNSDDGIAVVDLQGHYLLQNPAHEALIGYTDAELVGQTAAIHLGEEAAARLMAELAVGGRFQGEVNSRGKSGEVRILEVAAFTVRDAAGQPRFYVGRTRDITARRAAEQVLRRSYEELRALHRMTEAVNRATDLDAIHERALDYMRQAVGADRASVLRFDEAGVMRFVAWRNLSDDYRRAVDGHSPWDRSTVDAQPIAVDDVATNPALDDHLRATILAEGIRALAFIPLSDQGELLGKFMIYYDTPHAFAADELRLAQTLARHVAFAIGRQQREQRLLAANQARSAFLAAMSHELRTPLNAILGYADLLDMGVAGPLSTSQSQHLQRIRGGATHLLGIIEEILTFSRVEAGKETTFLERVDVTALAGDVATLVRPAAEQKGITVRVDLREAPLEILTDAGKLRQVLVNLLSNAIKFTDAGSIGLVVESAGDGVLIRVADTGMGIPPEHLAHIFEPFWQAERGTTRRAGGTGLGLTVTRQLVELLGGDVAVRSKPGSGSEFVVRLPAATAQAAPAATQP